MYFFGFAIWSFVGPLYHVYRECPPPPSFGVESRFLGRSSFRNRPEMTQTKSCLTYLTYLVKHCIFILDFSNSLIFQTNFRLLALDDWKNWDFTLRISSFKCVEIHRDRMHPLYSPSLRPWHKYKGILHFVKTHLWICVPTRSKTMRVFASRKGRKAGKAEKLSRKGRKIIKF